MRNLLALSARFLLAALVVSVSTVTAVVPANSVPIAQALAALSIVLDEVSTENVAPITFQKPASQCELTGEQTELINLSESAQTDVGEVADLLALISGGAYAEAP